MSETQQDMEETLRAAYRDMGGDEAIELEAPHEPVSESKPAVEPVGKGEKKASRQERSSAAQAKAEVGPQPGAEPPEPAATQKAAIEPPPGWAGSVKTHWPNLPPEVRSEILKREQDIHRWASVRGQAAKFGDEIYAEFQPYEAMLRSEGATPAQAVRELLKTAYLLRTALPAQKTQLVAELAQRYGVDLAEIQEGQLPQVDPSVLQLQQQVAQLEQYIQTQGTASQSYQDQRLMGEIEQFKSQPNREHFESVIPLMAAFLKNGQASNLDQAYDQAIWASPKTRQSVLDSHYTKQAEARKAQAEKAKQAASVNVQKRGAMPTGSPGNGSIEDTIRSGYKRMQDEGLV